MSEKNLFIPLKSEHYEDFESGVKKSELRIYGPRWNEKTCRIGRKVTLSKGYGKKNRMRRTVIGFEKVRPHQLNQKEYFDFIACFGHRVCFVARIAVSDV